MVRLMLLFPLLIVSIGAGPEDTTVQDVVRGNNQFAVELFGQTRSQPGNIFFSPYSISTALAMTYTGAAGATADEMAKTLHFAGDRLAFEKGYANLVRQVLDVDAKPPFQLEIGNALWCRNDLNYSEDFLERTERVYQATLHPIDFADDPEAARRAINAWVEARTHDRIKNLLGPNSVQRDTDLILTNAIYFKSQWARPFAKLATSQQDFMTSTGKVQVPLMSSSGSYRYLDAEADRLQVLEIPYAGDSQSMVVLLPKDVDGLERFESALDLKKMEGWLSELRPTEKVNVFLPRFKLDQSFQLAATLKALGMVKAFGSEADFSGITTDRPLWISEVVHKAFVEVNEEGTEAAAATGVVMVATAVMIPRHPPIVFRADHPFLFLIRDNKTGSILFLGRVVDPR